METETIAAIAALSQNGSISILRVSGPEALFSVSKIFFKKNKDSVFEPYDLTLLPTHTIHYGYICSLDDVCSTDLPVIDEVLVLIMRAPKSYTTEDVVEIHCHGGGFIAGKILELLLKKGVRLAKPGEFTKRAYLHGRIDLTQAESVMEVMRSGSDIALSTATSHLRGDIKNAIQNMRDTLLTDTAYLEAALDDPEHIELKDFPETLSKHLDEIEKKIDRLIENAENGQIISEGIKTAIAGKPNVGKSSFLNCILRKDRAIVTDIPGTTRDTLEEDVRIGRVLLKLIDTAGIRNTTDRIEEIGVKKTRKSIEDADFLICVLDVSNDLTNEDREILSECAAKPGIILLNKSDLDNKFSEKDVLSLLETKKPILRFCAKTGDGTDEFEDLVEKEIFETYYNEKINGKNEIYITNIRQKEALINAKKAFTHLRTTMSEGMPEDLLTIDLIDAYTCLGQVTGETVEDDLAEKIFKDFCMGK